MSESSPVQTPVADDTSPDGAIGKSPISITVETTEVNRVLPISRDIDFSNPIDLLEYYYGYLFTEEGAKMEGYNYQCGECNSIFAHPVLVTRLLDSRTTLFAMCPKCEKPLTIEKEVEGTVDVRAVTNGAFQCGECNRIFNQPLIVMTMKPGYAAERFLCPECKKPLTKDRQLVGASPQIEAIPYRLYGNLQV